MSLSYAILTALMEEPSTGAELLKRFDKSFGYFWSCTHQQIYRELKQLEGGGFLRSETSAQKSSSIVYKIEPKGEQQLKDWIDTDKNFSVIRDPFFVKLRAISNFDALSPSQVILDKRRHHEEKLLIYQQLGKKTFKGPLSRGQVIKKMVLDAGIRREQSNIEWCDECLQILAKLDTNE